MALPGTTTGCHYTPIGAILSADENEDFRYRFDQIHYVALYLRTCLGI